jgi:hypothetical protein
MSKRNLLQFYSFSNLLVGIGGIFFLLQQKSEEKSQVIFGLSLRKIFLILIISLLVIGIFFISNSLRRKSTTDRFSAPLLQKLSSDPFLLLICSFLLLAVSFSTVFLILDTIFNPDQSLALMAGKILGFLIFSAYLSLLTFLIFLLPIILDSVKSHQGENASRGRSIFTFVIFMFLWMKGIALLFNQQLNSLNGDLFFTVFTWAGILLAGLLIFFTFFPWAQSRGASFLLSAHAIWYILFVGIVLMIFLVGHIAYGANDDYYMMLIASGQIDGLPNPHLVYSNVLIGKILTSLYGLTLDINWYSIYLLLALFISCLILLRAILNQSKEQSVPYLLLAIFFLFVPRMFFTVNFTSTAMMCAFAGLILLFESVPQSIHKLPWGKLAGGVLLLTLSGLIRFQALGLTLLLFLPFLAMTLLKKRALPLFFALLLVGGLTITTYLLNQQAYANDPEWGTYLAYNQERGAISGTPKLKNDVQHQAFWDELGWGESGYELFANWVFVDRDVFTLQSLQAINQEYRYSLNDASTVFQSYKSLATNNPFEVLAFLGTLVFIFYPSRSIPGKQKRWLALTLTYSCLFLLGLSIYLRLPYYILVPTLLMICISLLYENQTITFSTELPSLPHSSEKKALVFFAVLLFCQSMLLTRTDQINLTRQFSRNYIIKEVKDALPRDHDSLVVVQATNFPLEWVSPLQSRTLPFDIVPTGWMINSPEYNHQLKKYGITNLMDVIASDPDIYLLGDGQDLIVDYLGAMHNVSAHEVGIGTFYLQYDRTFSQIYLTQLIEDSNTR